MRNAFFNSFFNAWRNLVIALLLIVSSTQVIAARAIHLGNSLGEPVLVKVSADGKRLTNATVTLVYTEGENEHVVIPYSAKLRRSVNTTYDSILQGYVSDSIPSQIENVLVIVTAPGYEQQIRDWALSASLSGSPSSGLAALVRPIPATAV